MSLCFQYPLKEVVVIHQDPEALKDIKSLQKYILEVSKLWPCFHLYICVHHLLIYLIHVTASQSESLMLQYVININQSLGC